MLETRNLSSQSSVPFPVLEEYGFWHAPDELKTDSQGNVNNGDAADFDIGNFSAQLRNSPEVHDSTYTVRTHWIILPKQFGSTSAGLLVAISSGLKATSNYNISMACSIDARWARGTTSMSGTRPGWASASYDKPVVSEISNKRAPPDDSGTVHFLPIDDGSWRRITITPPWLQSLTPPVPGSRSTTLETIFEHTFPLYVGLNLLSPYIETNTTIPTDANGSISIIPVPIEIAEHTISVLVADGMSRVGSALQPNISTLDFDMFDNFASSDLSLGQVIPPPPNSANTTQLHLSTTVDGYAYRIVGGTGTFAVIVLVAHMVIVVAHVLVVRFGARVGGVTRGSCFRRCWRWR